MTSSPLYANVRRLCYKVGELKTGQYLVEYENAAGSLELKIVDSFEELINFLWARSEHYEDGDLINVARSPNKVSP